MQQIEERFEKNMHLARETLFKMFYNPNAIAKKHKIDFEDLLQYAYEGLLRACKDYDGKSSSFKTFAISNIRWAILNALRKECNNKYWKYNREDNVEVDVVSIDNQKDDDSTYHDILPSSENTENKAIDNMISEEILSKLNENQKEIIYLKLEKGLTNKEIGKMWGRSGEAIRLRLAKARELLKDYKKVI